MAVTFRIVDSTEVGRAHDWHSGFTAANDALFPRTKEHFDAMVFARTLWCAVSHKDEYLAMSYADYSEPGNEWEIGGLMVAARLRGKGFGGIMMRLPLAHMLFEEQPFEWIVRPNIVAHVLEGNQDPARVIASLGFEEAHKVSIPAAMLPGLRTGSDGNVHGTEYHFAPKEGLKRLAKWASSWDGSLADGTLAEIQLLHGRDTSQWAQAFDEMATKLEESEPNDDAKTQSLPR